ncbi:MAG: hypothetical protein RLZZ584_4272, partial [Pseudomonadota bacterium]
RYRLVASARGQLVAVPGQSVTGADASLPLGVVAPASLPAGVSARYAWLPDGLVLKVAGADRARLKALHRSQLLLVHENAAGQVLDATALQHALALDELYAAATQVSDLGASVLHGGRPAAAEVTTAPARKAAPTARRGRRVGAGPDPAGPGGVIENTRRPPANVNSSRTRFRLWAPTAQAVALCIHPGTESPARHALPLRRDEASGVWTLDRPGTLHGQAYTYLVDVVVPGVGLVRNRVTDPYSLALTPDSRRSVVADLDAPDLAPPGWAGDAPQRRLTASTEMVIYELHVRDFSLTDDSVPAERRGRYLAFTEAGSRGMRHLRALAQAGLTDVHLLPVFDFATVPERGCASPATDGSIAAATPDDPAPQAVSTRLADADCYNWGYDPLHYSAPEGSYASAGADALARLVEFRRMVMGLHGAGLRVGMDVVYNHTSASGQAVKSVLDRIVPGYYHRLDAQGRVERSTCCDNTATEHAMMAKLMIDSVALWAAAHHVDSFRFDLMGHQPRDVMLALQKKVDAAAGRPVQLIGEGWNFGEVADGRRFPQAAQGVLNGSGIATFSDRGRDALRGGGAGDDGQAQVSRQGWLTGLGYAPNELTAAAPDAAALRTDLQHAADLVRATIAGSVRDYPLPLADGRTQPLHELRYGDQPAGYASQPGEVVNYVENHDNQTLWDALAFKLPLHTTAMERARVQLLGAAVVALSQGVAYFHAGQDVLRSKSMDRNSYDSGDWFNRLDWSYGTNHFGTGLPPARDNAASWELMRPRLLAPGLAAGPAEIEFMRRGFLDLLAIRASSSLLRLGSAAQIAERLEFVSVTPAAGPTVVAWRLKGEGLAGAGWRELLCMLNAGTQAESLALPALAGQDWALHPVHLSADAGDPVPAAQARHDAAGGRFELPARSAVVWVRR